MPRCARKLLCPVLVLLLAAPFHPAPDAMAAEGEASFTVDVKLDDTPLSGLEVELNCSRGDDPVLDIRFSPGDTRTFSVPVPAGAELQCLLGALPIPGQSLQFRGDGGSEVSLSPEGCLFNGVRAGHSNFCQIEIEQRTTGVTVYKKWIGSAGREPDVEIRLLCDGQTLAAPLQLNQGKPVGWELQISDPDGMNCDVLEIEREEFRADMSDCRGLIIRPGAQEECTMVNTKVVKMIQMLNRYGLFIMIGIFMIAGMIASRRMMP